MQPPSPPGRPGCTREKHNHFNTTQAGTRIAFSSLVQATGRHNSIQSSDPFKSSADILPRLSAEAFGSEVRIHPRTRDDVRGLDPSRAACPKICSDRSSVPLRSLDLQVRAPRTRMLPRRRSHDGAQDHLARPTEGSPAEVPGHLLPRRTSPLRSSSDRTHHPPFSLPLSSAPASSRRPRRRAPALPHCDARLPAGAPASALP